MALKINLNSTFPLLAERDMKFRRWKMAVDRCLNFDSVSENDPVKLVFDGRDPDYYVRSAIPGSLFIVSSFALIVVSSMLQQNGFV